MSEGSSAITLDGESRTEEPRSFIRQVRRSNRQRFTPEEKIRIVLEGLRHGVSIRELCRREGIHPAVFYAWLKDFMEAGKERLTRDTVRDATKAEVKNLRRENERLKQVGGGAIPASPCAEKTGIPGLD